MARALDIGTKIGRMSNLSWHGILGAAIHDCQRLFRPDRGDCSRHPVRTVSKWMLGPVGAVLLVACSSGGSVSAGKLDKVPAGDWGGQHVVLKVNDTGASVEFDCARGSLGGPLALDADGRFDVAGTLVREGGPVVPGREDVQDVRYKGRTDGRTMELEVVRPDGERIGPYQLRLGERPRLFKCY
jgi:hypothetical protein